MNRMIVLLVLALVSMQGGRSEQSSKHEGIAADSFINLTTQVELQLHGTKARISKALTAYLDSHAIHNDQKTMQFWFYDFKGGAVFVYTPIKKSINILVDPVCDANECEIVLMEKNDLLKLMIDPRTLEEIHRNIVNKLGKAKISIRATEVVTFEDLCRLTGKSYER